MTAPYKRVLTRDNQTDDTMTASKTKHMASRMKANVQMLMARGWTQEAAEKLVAEAAERAAERLQYS